MTRNNSTFTLIPLDHVPDLPAKWRICPTCLGTMQIAYAWKSSEHVVHYFTVCHCGSRSKGKLLHFRITSRGGLTK